MFSLAGLLYRVCLLLLMLLVHAPYPVFISIQCIFELFLLHIELKQSSLMVTTYQQSFTFFIHHFYFSVYG